MKDNKFFKSIEEKAAVISIFFKILFTVVKFAAYGLTGSLVILAEAWHSFSDIFTSIFVYFSVKEKHFYQTRKEDEHKSKIQKTLDILLEIDPEYKAALFIGLVLLTVSITLLRETVLFKAVEINAALISGLVFLLFSYLSYWMYKFETNVGKKEKSAALVSDGMHSKADMFSSLLAGITLILYTLGINIDRFAAFIISLLILQAAIEVLFNLGMNIYKANMKNGECSFHYKTCDIINIILNSDTWVKIIKRIETHFNISILDSFIFKKLKTIILVVIPMIVLIIYCSTSFYSVPFGEEALIERLGVPLTKDKPIQPGLHLKYPWPFDQVIKIKTKKIRQINIGNLSDNNSYALLWSSKHGTERPFLSADNNFFYPYFVAHYKIKNLYEFHYYHNNVRNVLENISYQVLTNYFSIHTFNEILIDKREVLEKNAREKIQKELDALKCGVELITINMKDAHPPIFISNSFEDVIAAFQDKQTMINEAIAYKNNELPLMKSNAYHAISQAETFVVDKINKAEGEAKRFLLQIESLNENPKLSLKKHYLEEIEQSMLDKKLVVVDPKSGFPEIWFDFEKNIQRTIE